MSALFSEMHNCYVPVSPAPSSQPSRVMSNYEIYENVYFFIFLSYFIFFLIRLFSDFHAICYKIDDHLGNTVRAEFQTSKKEKGVQRRH